VSPAGSGRRSHPLSRGHSRISPHIPRAARAAAGRDPVAAVRRAARSLTPGGQLRSVAGLTMRPASMHWSTPRRALRAPRSFRAVPWPR